MTGSPEARTWAIVVTYHPDATCLTRLLTVLTCEVERTIVVDNTPGGITLPIVDVSAVSVILNGHNAGVAAAQNVGIRAALDGGADHVLLLDQDSLPAAGMVAHLHQRLGRILEHDPRVGAVAASYGDAGAYEGGYVRFDTMGPRRIRCGTGEEGLTGLKVDVTISSGLLVPVWALDDIGLMDESLFIDHVDTDWCLRARARGYSLFIDCGARLEHHLGVGGQRIWLGRWRRIPKHVPERHYYQWRNALLLARRDYVPWSWTASVLVRQFGRAALATLVGPHRARTLYFTLRGLADGVAGVSGPIRAQ